MPPFQVNNVPTSPAPVTSPPVRRGKKVVLICILFVLLAALIAGGFFAVRKGYGLTLYESVRSFFGKKAVEKSIIDFIKEDYMQSVVLVACVDKTGTETGHGSGLYSVDQAGNPIVETNSHVVLAPDGEFYGCNVYFPRLPSGEFYSAAYFSDSVQMYYNRQSNIEGSLIEGLDYAVLTLKSAYKTANGVSYPFPPVARSAYDTEIEVCKELKEIQLTDPLLMLGYPGNLANKSITVTNGIVSGIADDGKIKVSAITNPGVSGGIVISPVTGCLMGIPTEVFRGFGGGVGYIISAYYKDAFIAGLTGEGTYGTRKGSERMVPYTAPSGTVFVRPEFWSSEPIPQQSIIINENSRIGLLPGFTMEVLDDGKNVRITNPGGVKFSAPREDIFDESFANFRFLEGPLPGGSVRGSFDAVLQGIDFLYGGTQEVTKPLAFSSTKDGYPLASFSYRVAYSSGTVTFFKHLMIFAHGRLYQFIASVSLNPDVQKDFDKDYKPILDKLEQVADSIEIR